MGFHLETKKHGENEAPEQIKELEAEKTQDNQEQKQNEPPEKPKEIKFNYGDFGSDKELEKAKEQIKRLEAENERLYLTIQQLNFAFHDFFEAQNLRKNGGRNDET